MRLRERRQLHNETDISLTLPDHIKATKGPKEFEAERNRPGREPNLESDVFTPILNTVFVAIGAMVLASYFAWAFDWPWHYVIPLTIGAAGIYFVSYTKLILKTLWITERVLQIDLDGDGDIGEPVTEISAIIPQDDGYTKMFRDRLGIAPEVVKDWARAATIGKPISINAWTGQGAPFTRTQYENFLATLAEMGVVEKGEGNKGWYVTPAGNRYLGNILRS